MRTSSLSISAGLHVAMVVITTVSLPWLKRDFEIPAPIMIEFVELGKVTETTKQAQRPTPKEEKPKEAPPPPAAKNTAAEPTPPPPKPAVKEEKKPEKKAESKPLDPAAPPDKKKDKKEDKKETAKAAPQRDFSSVLKNLAEPKVQPAPPVDAPDDMKLDETGSASGQNAPLGQKMTMSEEDALRRQLERCWNVPFGAKDAENLNVEIFMVINTDRTLRDARVVDTARYNSDSFFRAAADSALRAVRNPLCSPFQLPPDKYDVWKTITVNFNPREMF